MAEGQTFQAESKVCSDERQLRLNEMSEKSNDEDYEKRKLTFDEIYEESIDSDTIQQQENDNSLASCDQCFIKKLIKVIACFMCIACEKYYCKNCFKKHRRRNFFHKFIRSENGEKDGFVVENESEKVKKEKIRKTNVYMCDVVNTKHCLDKLDHCYISGLTGYANSWWVACNNTNRCIKVFSLGSNVLQRYIRLGSKPLDVTEIIVENKTTEQDSASCSVTVISETDRKPDRKHLLAVTLPRKRLILILDLGKHPAAIHSKIKMEEECYSIDFYDGNIYTVCGERSLGTSFSVYMMSVEGVSFKTVHTDVPLSNISSYVFPYITVLNGNIYMTDPDNDRVVCYNDETRVLHEIEIGGSWPQGICVDRSEDKVYVCSAEHHKVYELESNLIRYTSVLDQTIRYMKGPRAMCFYSDKLYVSIKLRSHVTVVRLL